MSTPSETISTDTSQRPTPAAKRAIRARGVRRVGGHDLGPLAGDAREPVGEPLGVLLVGRDHEAAGVRVLAGAQVDAAARRRRAARGAIQSPSGSSAVRSRRAASAGGQDDVEVGACARGRRSSTPCRRRRGGR